LLHSLLKKLKTCFFVGTVGPRPTQRWKVFAAECTLWCNQGSRVKNAWEGMAIHPRVLKSCGSLRRSLFQTKHFQTLFWTPDVRLVDCPGLVMPNFVPMETQVRNHRNKHECSHRRHISVAGFERNSSDLKSFSNSSVHLSRIAAFAVGTSVRPQTSCAFHFSSRG